MKSLSLISGQYLWVLIIAVTFVVHSLSFSGIPVIEEQHSVLADADAANFVILIEGFQIAKKFGNEYQVEGRDNGDIAQKHKIHHFLYAMVGSLIYKTFLGVYSLIGISSKYAMYSVNAFIASCNMGLLYLLMRRIEQNWLKISLFLFFYGFSLSTWIYSSIPDSWLFSATLILAFLVLSHKREERYLPLSFFVGICMLNNIFLSSLLFFVVARQFLTVNTIRFIRNSSLAGLVAFGTWGGALYLLSFYDNSLSPNNFIRYTLWFKEYVGQGLPFYDPYVWKSMVSNLYINSIVSNQADPRFPQEALLYTFKESYIGISAIIVYLGLIGIVLFNVFKKYRDDVRNRKGLQFFLARPEYQWMIYCLIWLLMILKINPGAAMLYSTTMVPFIILIAYQFINMDSCSQRVWLYLTILMVFINNLNQVMKFREALILLS